MQDFQIHIDVQRGESTLVILEVFPEDEGEYMCKAENPLGTAITHCHLFVRSKLPNLFSLKTSLKQNRKTHLIYSVNVIKMLIKIKF